MIATTEPTPGTQISVVYYEDSLPRTFGGTYQSMEPPIIRSSSPLCQFLDNGSRAMLIFQDAERCLKADVEVQVCQRANAGWELQTGPIVWETVDRRRYPRYDAVIPTELRAVREDDGTATLTTFDAITVNVSLGGANFSAARALPAGSLVNATLKLGVLETARILGVVAWNNDGEFGVEFLDFIGDARYRMHRYLSQLELR